jgi:outer membrane murein-binding lipoprotein Lpp
MKTFVTFLLFAVFTLQLTGCSTPAERKRHAAQRVKEDAKREAERRQRDREDARRDRLRAEEDARRDRQRDAEDFERFLFKFARDIGKTPSELTRAQRADARRAFELR